MHSTRIQAFEKHLQHHKAPEVGALLPSAFGEEVVSIKDRTGALVRGLEVTLDHHGAPLEILRSLGSQVRAFLDICPDETVWLTRAKHMLTYPLAKYLRNDPPEAPSSVFKPTGGLRGWMRQRLTCFNRKNSHLWYTWLQCKRATLPASDAIVEATYDKHFKVLSTPDNPSLHDDLLVDEIFEDKAFINVLNQVRLAVSECDLSVNRVFHNSPSTSASFESKRGEGGAARQLFYMAGLDENTIHSSELVRMDYFPICYGDSVRYGVVVPVFRLCGEEDWLSLSEVEMDLSRPTKCTIQAVLEPMKVRVISKGEALPYYTMKPVQKAMHTAMRRMPCFRLIGRPFSPTDLVGLRKKADPTDEWFSIDYSAATDGLSWAYSGRIFEYIIQDLPDGVKEVARRVLGPHHLHYPFMGEAIPRGMQQNGQLMGSVLSFPILCLANLGLYLKVNHIHQKGWTQAERLNHVLINGDDMLYAAPSYLWGKHVAMGDSVGLKMSVGKAYRHREYANINSIGVHYRMDGDSVPHQLDFLNVGLFFNQHKVQGGSDEEGRESPLIPNVNTLLQGSLENRKCHLLARFIDTHSSAIREECRAICLDTEGPRKRRVLHTRNMFLPESTGGMGVVPPPGWRFRLTEMDRRVAAAVVYGHSAPFSGTGPKPGFDLLESETLQSSPWAIRFSAPSERPIRLLDASQKLSRFVTRAGIKRFALNRCSASI